MHTLYLCHHSLHSSPSPPAYSSLFICTSHLPPTGEFLCIFNDKWLINHNNNKTVEAIQTFIFFLLNVSEPFLSCTGQRHSHIHNGLNPADGNIMLCMFPSLPHSHTFSSHLPIRSASMFLTRCTCTKGHYQHIYCRYSTNKYTCSQYHERVFHCLSQYWI